jgi:hypothetical protein
MLYIPDQFRKLLQGHKIKKLEVTFNNSGEEQIIGNGKFWEMQLF